MTVPEVKGWCPGAHRPMMSGDGLIVRIRPHQGRLSADMAMHLAELADVFANGIIELTNRANLQLRGVQVERYGDLLAELEMGGLLDRDPARETRRNVMVTPLWSPGDVTDRIHAAFLHDLDRLPHLPAKVGIVLDTGAKRVLHEASGDIRIERGETDALIVRAAGCDTGAAVTETDVVPMVLEMAQWLAKRITAMERRMVSAVAKHPVPKHWFGAKPAATERLQPGQHSFGYVLGAPLGQITSRALKDVLGASAAPALRLTSDRLFMLEGASSAPESNFISSPDDPLLTSDACPGAPHCSQASVATRDLARSLAQRIGGHVHVSGCAKGCARARAADYTLVGRDGRFDLVKNGCSWDEPAIKGLTPAAAARLTA